MSDPSSLATLKWEILRRGWDRKPTSRLLLELLGHLVLSLAGLVLAAAAPNWPVLVCGLIVSTLGSMGVATNTHTSAHHATSDRRWLNELLTYFGLPFFLGLSATYWWHKHARHHSGPNVIGLDDDVSFWPLFALTDEEVSRSRGFRRLYYTRLQWLMLPFALAGAGFNMQKNGWLHVLRMLADRRRRRRAHLVDLGALVLHIVAAIGLPALFLPASTALALYVARFGLFGYAIIAVFGPAHMPAEAVCVSASGRHRDYLQRQVSATLNFRTGPLGRLICSGLDYQIEHHLFPNVSHVHYPALSPLVEDFCVMRGLPYRRYGWTEAMRKIFLAFRTPKPVISAPIVWMGPAWTASHLPAPLQLEEPLGDRRGYLVHT